jgi:peptidoglycan/xylan/chitin deacetylase (PgdA/CDA1 family)
MFIGAYSCHELDLYPRIPYGLRVHEVKWFMPHMQHRFFAILLATLCVAQPASAAGRDALQRACFTPAELAAQAGEIKPARGIAGAQIPAPSKIALAASVPLPPNLRGAIRRVDLPKGRKLIALTLDLCEQPGEVAGYDGPVVDYLRSTGTKATVFAGGKWLMSHNARTQQMMADPLFEIGVHGWAHRNVRALSGAALFDEMINPLRAYTKVRAELAARTCASGQTSAIAQIPDHVMLHRFPYGACSPAALQMAAENGLMSIQWDVSTGDPAPSQSARAIADAMLRNTKPGSIIIAHANGRGHHTAEALPLAIPKLKAMGFEFVTVSELLAAGRPVIADTCFDNRPGDTDKYDFLYSKRPTTPGAQGNGWRSTTTTGISRGTL